MSTYVYECIYVIVNNIKKIQRNITQTLNIKKLVDKNGTNEFFKL